MGGVNLRVMFKLYPPVRLRSARGCACCGFLSRRCAAGCARRSSRPRSRPGGSRCRRQRLGRFGCWSCVI